MKRFVIFLILASSFLLMGQLKISGIKPSKITGYEPTKWDGVKTEIGGGTLPADTWSPTNATLTLQDSVPVGGDYLNPEGTLIPNTNKVIVTYTDNDEDRQLETFAIAGDSVGDVIDTWEISADGDAGNTMRWSKVFSIDSNNRSRFAIVTIRTGQDLAGIHEDSCVIEIFTTNISNAGSITKSRRDSLYIGFGVADQNDVGDLDAVQFNDSLLVCMGRDNTGQVQYTGVVATWDTIYTTQDLYTATGTGLANDLYAHVHKTRHDGGDSSALWVAYSGNGDDGYLMFTYMSDQDTVVETHSTWEYNTGNGQYPAIAHLPTTKFSTVLFYGTAVSLMRIFVVTGDTVDTDYVEDNQKGWSFQKTRGRPDLLYIPNSDTLLYSAHKAGDTLFSVIHGIDESDSTLHQSFVDADTLVSANKFDYPNIVYIREGQFLVLSGGGTNGMKTLYEMD